MHPERTRAWLTLTDAGLPRATIPRLLRNFGSPEAVLSVPARELERRVGLSGPHAQRLREAVADHDRRERQLALLQRHAIRLLEPDDPGFPAPLLALSEPPPVLFVRGEYLPGRDEAALAIVGTRHPTAYGREIVRGFVRELAPVLTIASGLARGIDTLAHTAALEHPEGRTIAVAAAGLDVDYPSGSEPLRARIVDGRGAILSAHPPMVKSLRPHFHYRNYLLAGLCWGTLVVEAAHKSGSLVTARAAAEEGREVLAVPGDITRENSGGTNRLIAEGAALVGSPRDVLEALAPRLSEEAARLARSVGSAENVADEPQLPPAQRLVLERIRHESQTLDDLMAQLVPGQLSVGELTGALLELELEGLIRQAGGNVWMPAT